MTLIVRYADDFVVRVHGTEAGVRNLREQIADVPRNGQELEKLLTLKSRCSYIAFTVRYKTRQPAQRLPWKRDLQSAPSTK